MLIFTINLDKNTIYYESKLSRRLFCVFVRTSGANMKAIVNVPIIHARAPNIRTVVTVLERWFTNGNKKMEHTTNIAAIEYLRPTRSIRTPTITSPGSSTMNRKSKIC